MKYKVGILTNISLQVEFAKILSEKFPGSMCERDIRIIQISEILTMEKDFSECNLIVVILDYFTLFQRKYMSCGMYDVDDFDNYAYEECEIIYKWIRKISDCPIIWFGFEDYSAKEKNIYGATWQSNENIELLNYKILKLLSEDIFVDMKYLVARVGIDNAYDDKRRIRWNLPYSKAMQEMIACEIYKQYLIINKCTPKCIVLDCDGVLWGGILAEDGIDGIQLSNEGVGRYYRDFQLLLRNLYYHGVLLAICSKNDIEDVMKVFEEHRGMILKKEHIICHEINWEDKCSNIKRIADRLNIGYDSMVFIDDSDFEINAVNKCLPEVLTILYDNKSIYKHLSCFNLRYCVDIKQIEIRNRYYQTIDLREKEKAKASTPIQYKELLETKIDIHVAQNSELNRISELTNRTNKCTIGTRYTLADLKKYCNDTHNKLYSLYVTDKFSDLGLVGAMGIRNEVLDIFALSCRALGRGIEQDMVKKTIEIGAKEYRFFDTGKNKELLKMFQASSLRCI